MCFQAALESITVFFWFLEDRGLLDISNELHMFVLHIVFIPRLNQTIELFAQGWDNHPLRTERNRTPNQMWASGQLTYQPDMVDDFYGIDFEGPPAIEDDILGGVDTNHRILFQKIK